MTHTILPDLQVDRSLSALLAGRPPRPGRSRFQPLRMGMIGIWQYDEQEFFFHHGRLVLRGRNGSGKTKVLEVTSPFLFDANLTARRLDPFGTAARSMRDNLLYGEKKHQIGYVWCEYGRETEDGDTEYLTLGAGMRAQAAKSGAPDSWYFLTTQRVGVDFQLYDNVRKPATEQDLVGRLGQQSVFSTADSYRRAVATDLFGLTAERFRSLVELLITLRRPKLSENFGVARLTEILSDGLPPVEQSLVDELAKGFDELARDQEDLQALMTAAAEVDRFLVAYRTYARRMVRYVAAKVRAAVTQFDGVTRQATRAKEQLDTAEQAVTTLGAKADELTLARTRQNSRIRALEQRPEVEQHATLIAMERRAAAARKQASEAERRLAQTTADTELVEEEFRSAQENLTSALSELEEFVERAGTAARLCRLEFEHDVQADRMQNDPSAARTVLFTVIAARKSAITHARQLCRAVEKAQAAFERVQAARDDLVARRDDAAGEVTQKQEALDAAVEAVTTAVMSWVEDCREHLWSDVDVAALLDAVARAGEPGAPALIELVRARSNTVEATLLSACAAVDAERISVRAAHTELTEQRERIANERELPPGEPLVTRRDRDGDTLSGAPFWRLMEFVEGVPDRVRDQVEAALLGAGLLDAWVMPDGAALRSDTLDTFLHADVRAAQGASLLAVLRPVDDSAVADRVVRDVLAAIGYFENGSVDVEGPWVSADGGWSIGPLTGRTEGGPASHIGAAAREAARRRALSNLDRRIAQLAREIADLDADLDGLALRIDHLREERTGCPRDDQVRAGRMALDTALALAAKLTAEVRHVEDRLAGRRAEVATATGALTAHANEHSLPPAVLELDNVETALGDYREAVVDMVAHVNQLALLRSALASVLGRAERQRDRRAAATREHRMAATEAAELVEEHAARNELIGADVSRVMAELDRARTTLHELEQLAEEVQTQLQDAAELLGVAKGQLAAVERDRDAREDERKAAVDEYDKLRRLGFLDLAEIFGQHDGPASLTRSIEEARRAESVLREEDMTDKGRNAGRNLVDERFRELQMRIGGPDWRPWGDNEGELFVVRVTHNGIDETLPALRTIIRNEVDTRKTYLDDQERKLFAEVLLGRIGEHLRQCRVEAASLCTRMNELLADRPTASGMQMRLRWLPDDEAGPEVGAAVALLDAQSTKFLADDARDQLVGFLSERVRKAREDDLVGDWRVHLREALDYRKWSRFHLEVRHGIGDKWSPLSDAKHQQGSGGEKAVMLQLPLFVAAAAHYTAAAPTAPRPVYLDEAFAGIDAEMRGSCMRLLTDLDLDFVLASHDEWGFHSEVPGLVTYSLYRDPTTPGVLTTPFVWDGHTPHRLDDPALGHDEPGELDMEQGMIPLGE